MSESADAFLLAKLADIAESETQAELALRGIRMLLRLKFKPGSYRCDHCGCCILKPDACAGVCPYCNTKFGPSFDAYLEKRAVQGA